jgi:hypothetical protein
MKGRSRKIFISILILLTVGLAMVSAYIAYRINQEVAPEDSAAASCEATPGCAICGDDGSCNKCCGEWAGTCPEQHSWVDGWNACNNTNQDPGASCTVSVTNDVTSFTLSDGCGSGVTISTYERPYSGSGHAFYPTCITDESNGTLVSRHAGSGGSTYTAYSVGKCVQIDADGEGIGQGVCRCVPADPEPEPEPVGCYGDCTDNSGCQSGYSCQDGKCVNPDCPNETDCICPSPVECNASCDEDNLCPETLTCVDGVCRDPNCPNETDCVCPQIRTCNASCDENNLCPDSLSCIDGVCRNADCPNDTDCSCTVDCGDPCSSNSDCPLNHVCDPSQNRCVLEVCLNNPNCTNNGCVLPQTGIIDDNKLPVGLFALLVGVILIKFDILAFGKHAFSLMGEVSRNGRVEREEKMLKKFERKIEKGMRKRK